MFTNVDESLLLRVVLAALFCVNCVLELAAVCVGVYAVKCLKVPAFQLHAQMVSTLFCEDILALVIHKTTLHM